MPDLTVLDQVRELADRATVKADEYSGIFGTIKAYILDHFGHNGLMAAYLVVAVIVLLLTMKVARTAVSTVKYLVIPAVALALLATYFAGFSFFAALPVTVTVCALLLLFKG